MHQFNDSRPSRHFYPFISQNAIYCSLQPQDCHWYILLDTKYFLKDLIHHIKPLTILADIASVAGWEKIAMGSPNITSFLSAQFSREKKPKSPRLEWIILMGHFWHSKTFILLELEFFEYLHVDLFFPAIDSPIWTQEHFWPPDKNTYPIIGSPVNLRSPQKLRSPETHLFSWCVLTSHSSTLVLP